MEVAGKESGRTAPDLAIIDYGMGNLRSVARAWEKVGARVRLVYQPEDIGQADALVFPGQGAIVDCMSLLHNTGFDHAIRTWIADDRPFFGICLGLQALFEHSEEGDTPCLGVFPGRVRRFRLDARYKVPHMGWNAVQFQGGPPAMRNGLPGADDQFYFVHSYYVEPAETAITWGTTDYGGQFTSAVHRGNCFATQFHPEKSQAKGLQIYRNFLGILHPRINAA